MKEEPAEPQEDLLAASLAEEVMKLQEVEEEVQTEPAEASLDTRISSLFKSEGDAPEDTTQEPEEEHKTTLQADKTFGLDTLKARKEMTFIVPEREVVVTEEDKVLYLKATLNDVPTVLPVELDNGVVVHCRSLTMHETDLVSEALMTSAIGRGDSAALFAGTIVQQCRLSMQMVAFNGVPADYLEYKYEHNKVKEQAVDLYNESMKRLMNMQATKFSMCVKALNVFQHKITRLHEAALDKTFWNPAAQD